MPAAHEWRVEVVTADDGIQRWVCNEVRYDNEDGARAVGLDLATRWLAVINWRVVNEEVPLGEEYLGTGEW